MLQAERQVEIDLAKAAHRLTADLVRPNRALYWFDLLASSVVLYGGLALAATASGPARGLGAIACILALYRAMSFIHELTHLRGRDVPGFHLAWNGLIGTPFLIPSMLYEGVHNLHHAKHRYGTAQDPEYLPLSRSSWTVLAAFMVAPLFAPLGGFLRFAVAAPLSFVVPGMRGAVLRQFSAITINPAFRREDLDRFSGAAGRAQEVACWLWSWALVALVAEGGAPRRFVLLGAAALSLATFVNQVRTLVAHAWNSDGRPLSFTAQFEDSINVPPPAWLPAVWAPVGLRYHALHHLLPRIPYHALGAAHRRLAQALPPSSAYHRVQHRGLLPALGAVLGRAAAHRRGQGSRAEA